MCIDPSIILPYSIDVLALEEKSVPAISLKIDPQARYVLSFKALFTRLRTALAFPSLIFGIVTRLRSSPIPGIWPGADNSGGDDGSDSGGERALGGGVLIRGKSSFRINSSKVSMRFFAFSARCSAANRADSTRVRRVLTCAYWSVSTSVGTIWDVVAFVQLARFARGGKLGSKGCVRFRGRPRALVVWTVIESSPSDSWSNSNELLFRLFKLFLLFFGILRGGPIQDTVQ